MRIPVMLNKTPPTALPETYRLDVYPDPLVENHGHAVDSRYADDFWLPTLGPTGLCLTRLLVRELEDGPTDIHLPTIGARLGLGESLSRNSQHARTWARLRSFGFVVTSPHRAAVRTHLPTLTTGQIHRLAAPIRAAHQNLVGLS